MHFLWSSNAQLFDTYRALTQPRNTPLPVTLVHPPVMRVQGGQAGQDLATLLTFSALLLTLLLVEACLQFVSFPADFQGGFTRL